MSDNAQLSSATPFTAALIRVCIARFIPSTCTTVSTVRELRGLALLKVRARAGSMILCTLVVDNGAGQEARSARMVHGWTFRSRTHNR